MSEPLDGVEKADEATRMRGAVADKTDFENPGACAGLVEEASG